MKSDFYNEGILIATGVPFFPPPWVFKIVLIMILLLLISGLIWIVTTIKHLGDKKPTSFYKYLSAFNISAFLLISLLAPGLGHLLLILLIGTYFVYKNSSTKLINDENLEKYENNIIE